MNSCLRVTAFACLLCAFHIAAPRAALAQQQQQPQQQQQQQQQPAAVDGFKVGDFTFRPGGRVKLDVIRDFKPMDNEDSFDTRAIPIDAGERTNSNLIAKETRLSIDIRGPVEGHELRMYVEGDFYGSGSAFRMRHAYGTWRGLLAGQTWSTFMDEDNLPRTIDFESPTAMAIIRQAQLRYTWKFGGGASWSVAVEDNKSNIIVPDNIPGRAEFPSPDFATRLRFGFGDAGHIQAGAFTGAARFRRDGLLDTDNFDDEEPDTVMLWGTMLSANFSTYGRDTIYGVVTFGDGIGRYRGGITAVPDFDGRLHAAQAIAYMAGYEHFWASRWSTNAVYSFGDADEQPFYTDEVNRSLTYGAVNLLWWFLGDRGWMGVEYLYGRREVFGVAPNTGIAHRLQYAVRFNLP